MDTDSFIAYIKTYHTAEDVETRYKDTVEDVDTRFDTLNYELNRPLLKKNNKKKKKKKIGAMEDGLDGKL